MNCMYLNNDGPYYIIFQKVNQYLYAIKPVLKGICWEPDNCVVFMSSSPSYTGSKYIHYSLNRENENDLFRQRYVIYRCS